MIGGQVEIGGGDGRLPGDVGLADLIAELEARGTRILQQHHAHAGDPRQWWIPQADPGDGRPVPAARRLAVPEVQPVVISGKVLHCLAPVVPLVVCHLSDGGGQNLRGESRHHRHEQAPGPDRVRVAGGHGSPRGDPGPLGRLEQGEAGRGTAAGGEQAGAREPQPRAEQLSSCDPHLPPCCTGPAPWEVHSVWEGTIGAGGPPTAVVVIPVRAGRSGRDAAECGPRPGRRSARWR